MSPLSGFFNRVRQYSSRLPSRLGRRWRNKFYVYLAIVFSLLTVIDAAFIHFTANMRQAAFDAMVRYRLIVRKPDRDIVIVDIN